MTVISPRTAWAVGKVQTVDGDVVLIERRNGIRWATVPAPSLAAGNTSLAAVGASAAGSVWAVGRATSTSTPGGTLTLALHCC